MREVINAQEFNEELVLADNEKDNAGIKNILEELLSKNLLEAVVELNQDNVYIVSNISQIRDHESSYSITLDGNIGYFYISKTHSVVNECMDQYTEKHYEWCYSIKHFDTKVYIGKLKEES